MSIPLDELETAFFSGNFKPLKREPIFHEDCIEIGLCLCRGNRISTFVSDEDADLSQRALSWGGYSSKTKFYPYAMRRVLYKGTRRSVKVHRLIAFRIFGSWDEDTHFPDHIDGNTLNNRRENLRIITREHNGANRRYLNPGTSPYPGVHWHKAAKKWTAEIQMRDKRKYLGLYDTEYEAYMVYAAHYFEIHDAWPPDHEIWSVPPTALASD
jgi:hypothetical protein